jgi:alkylation response protein AidB-like acyl-CoA dehydrogenase
VDLSPSPAQQALRAELRRWLADAVTWGADGPPPHDDLGERVEFLRGWQQRLAEARWVGVTWPAEYGGRGAGPVESYVVTEELAAARAPELVGRIGVNLVGPTLLAHGTPAQRARWLPRILDAGEIWCQLFSEPGAGSDLASLSTRAERDSDAAWERRGSGATHDGDDWLLTGQKVWTSYAQFADWGLCLARTNPTARKTRGISAFAVDMHAAGVTVRPLVQLTGEAEFNEVFLDGVRVPDEARIGDVDDGWRVAGSTLSHERGTNPRQLAIHAQAVDALLRLAEDKAAYDDPRLAGRIADAYVGIRLFQLHSWRSLSRLERGEQLGPESSLVKLHWSQASQRLHAIAMDVLGDDAAGWGRWQRQWLYYLASSVFAGTNEIQRNVLAERVLGLPKELAGAKR